MRNVEYLIYIGNVSGIYQYDDTHIKKYKKYVKYYNDISGRPFIINDKSEVIFTNQYDFITLEEWRDSQLNKLNIK